MHAVHAVVQLPHGLFSSSSSSFYAMAPPTVSILLVHLLLSIFFFNLLFADGLTYYNVVDFGADPRGESGSTAAFRSAWSLACGSSDPAGVHVPAGRFLVGAVVFAGPCNNTAMEFSVDGTVVAPLDYTGFGQSNAWIRFERVEGVSIRGGTIDGQGESLWACKANGNNCPTGPKSLTISHSKNVAVTGLTSINSKSFHIMVRDSADVRLRDVTVVAPGDSPNTDGIHVKSSDHVRITNATIGTGDDCIAMSAGTTNLVAEGIFCGPGHGISIGSLGNKAEEAGVANITVAGAVFNGTQNGLRIKTWAKPSNGFVTGVSFHNARMHDVDNPIIIDQTYCPGIPNCPNKDAGVQITNVTYSNIQGTSSTQVAMEFDCSPTNPCRDIHLHDINLTYGNQAAQSDCKHVTGTSSGYMIPPSCLQ